jgi:ribosomal RNA-processing protein 9
MEQMDEDSSDVPSSSDEEDDGSTNYDDLVSKRLERHRLKQQGMYERNVASKVQQSVEGRWKTIDPDISNSDDVKSQSAACVVKGHIKLLRGHDLTPTCVALHSPSGSVGYSASKDNSILMWDIEHEKRISTIIPRWNPNTCDYTRNSGEILSMAASDDGRYLAVGGRDSTVKIFDVRQKQINGKAPVGVSNGIEIRGLVTTFEGHKGPVTALAFRSQSLQLFSGSNDRCIRHYNLDEMAYVETLYGHQAPVTGISCHGIRHEMPYSVARDRTARAWKLAEETHMIYRGGSKISNADCISAIKDDYFLTGHEDGVLSLWFKDKKRPIVSIPSVHGFNRALPRGIASCASLGGSDFAATGSSDGFLRLWKVRKYCRN